MLSQCQVGVVLKIVMERSADDLVFCMRLIRKRYSERLADKLFASRCEILLNWFNLTTKSTVAATAATIPSISSSKTPTRTTALP